MAGHGKEWLVQHAVLGPADHPGKSCGGLKQFAGDLRETYWKNDVLLYSPSVEAQYTDI